MKFESELSVVKVFLFNPMASLELVDLNVLDVLENPNVRAFVRWASKYVVEHKECPTATAIEMEFKNTPVESLIQKVVSDSDLMETPDRFVVQLVERERQKRALLRLAKEVLPKVNDESVDIYELWERGRRLLEIRKSKHYGIEYNEDFPRTYVRRYADLASKSFVYSVPTGIPQLDSLFEGGVKKGWLCVVAGGSGFGKSAFLQNITLVSALYGKNVVYVTLEMTDWEVEARLDRLLYIALHPELGPSDYVYDHQITQFQTELEQVVRKYVRGKVRIFYFPPHTLSPVRLGGILDSVRDPVDVVVVDYGDLMRPISSMENHWLEVGEVFELLKGVAVERDVVLWTATQVGKSYQYSKQVLSSHVYGSSEKQFNSDLLLTLNRTPEEQSQGKMRLYIAKARNAPTGRFIPLEMRGGLLMVPVELTKDSPSPDSSQKEGLGEDIEEELNRLLDSVRNTGGEM